VSGDSQQPSQHRRLPSERVELLEGHQEHLLDQILDQVGSWREPLRDVPVDRVGVPGDELGGRLAIFLQYRVEQDRFLARQRITWRRGRRRA
jgi:hypothetical protein